MVAICPRLWKGMCLNVVSCCTMLDASIGVHPQPDNAPAATHLCPRPGPAGAILPEQLSEQERLHCLSTTLLHAVVHGHPLRQLHKLCLVLVKAEAAVHTLRVATCSLPWLGVAAGGKLTSWACKMGSASRAGPVSA